MCKLYSNFAKVLNILLIFLFCLTNLFAKKISENVAEKIAYNWLSYQQKPYEIKNYQKLMFNNKVIAYLFQLKPKGYIVIPADDILPPIKAYSFNNNYIVHGKGFYNLLEKEIYSLIFSTNSFSQKIFGNNKEIWDKILQGSSFASIEEKDLDLTTKWDQSPYYNNFMPFCDSCPEYANGHYFVGCNAVAIGQIMKYYNWPYTGRDFFEYTDSSSGIHLSANFKEEFYNWDLMPDTLDSSSSQSEINEVAKLLYDVAVSIQSKLEFDGTSGSLYSAADAIYKFFKYYPAKYILREDFSNDTEWFNTFKEEIDAGRLVLFGLSSYSYGGHAVVLHGYKIDSGMNQVHLNMGWSGVDDNWYTLNNIVTSTYIFNDIMGQDAVINIKKDTNSKLIYYHDSWGSNDLNYSYQAIGYSFKSTYGIVKFTPSSDGYLSHISFFLPQTNMSYGVALYSGENLESAINSTPIFSAKGSSQNTGWHYVEPQEDINILLDTNYFVVVKFTGDKATAGYYYVVPTDVDGTGTGNSYIAYSKDSLQQLNDSDILIRMAVRSTTLEEKLPVINEFDATPLLGVAPLDVTFKCYAYNIDGSITSYKWDFNGDGVIDEVTTNNTATYTYKNAGLYTAKVTVVNSKGYSVTSEAKQIQVCAKKQLCLSLESLKCNPGFECKIENTFKTGDTFKLKLNINTKESDAMEKMDLYIAVITPVNNIFLITSNPLFPVVNWLELDNIEPSLAFSNNLKKINQTITLFSFQLSSDLEKGDYQVYAVLNKAGTSLSSSNIISNLAFKKFTFGF